MSVKNILAELSLLPDKSEISSLKKEAAKFCGMLKDEISRQKIDADIFIGGSFAKGTLVKKEGYDIDIFVRFDWEYENLSSYLDNIIKNVCKKNKIRYEKIHGSRDYFKINKEGILFEVIPVLRVKNPREERNVTDLSYFHVRYIKSKINSRLAAEIAAAKTFCRAHGVYGAESYIQGFSGYALECLILQYKSFEKMLRELLKAKERIILDPAKKYKDKNEIFISLNEGKLQSPIILIDPTWKERNVLAALSLETFNRFKESAREFLKRPSISYFSEKKFDVNEMKKEAKRSKAELLHFIISTEKQSGDIAGTKMKKFTNFVVCEIEQYFEIKRKEFIYNNKQEANVYFILKSKGEIVRIGPPSKMKDACAAFKKANKNVFEKNGNLHATIKANFSPKQFMLQWTKKYSKKIKEMDIAKIEIK